MQYQKHNYNYLIVTTLTAVPILLWYLAPVAIPRFSNSITTLANFGQMLGLAGTALFAINLILSARLKIFDKIFAGLNHMYLAHNHIGQIALMLLLAHPLFLIPKYAGGSLASAFAFLMPGQNWNINFGISALAIMIFLIMLTLYLRPKYNIWKITHKFLGGAFFLASLHIYLIPSDVARYAPLRIYMLTLVALGLLAFFYRAVFGRFFVKHYLYIVSAVKKINNAVVQINLKPIGEQIQFNPGQFAFISFVDKNISSESHPFSFASANNDTEISVIAKRLGDYTAQLDLLSTGAKAKLEGPYGAFDFRTAQNKKQIWIAGGIGITPFLSMAQSLAPTDDYQIDLYYCVKNQAEIIPVENKSQIKINFFCSDESGKINMDVVEKMSGGLTNKDFFICAPPAMIGSLRKQLLKKKISQKLIHSEEFNF